MLRIRKGIKKMNQKKNKFLNDLRIIKNKIFIDATIHLMIL